MAKHSHEFVETYDGFLGFGMDRQTDENTVEVYLQKFSDDELLKVALKRMADEELAEIFEMISKLLKTHFTEPEYHKYFLKDEE
jgi:hypothetical protein